MPDYDARIEVMRGEGNVDRDIFLKKVYFPTLKYLGVSRAELVNGAARLRARARQGAADALVAAG